MMRATASKDVQHAARAKEPARRVTVYRIANRVPQLQRKACACGGTCPRCREQLPIQEKLVINEPGDQYEQDADRIAEQVMRMPAPEVRRQAVPIIPLVQRKTGSNGAGKIVPPIVNDVLSSPGQPLDRTTRTFFEPRFGQDFSRMRIHADAHAAESARAVEARAYTVGQHVVFGTGEYAPATAAGQRLLAHELTHVVQQDREYADDLGVMQRSPLECSQRFRQTERVYYGGTEEFARGKLEVPGGKVDPSMLSKFRTFGLRAFPDLMKLLKDNNLDFDTNQPLEAVDCSPGPGIRYPYPHGNALGLEAVEFCQEGDYVKFNFTCVLTSVQREAREMVNKLRKDGNEVVINLGGEASEIEVKNWPYAINLNPNPRVPDVPNLVREPADRLGELFEAGSADKVVARRLPTSAVSGDNIDKVAKGAFDVLRKGGELEMHIYGGSPGFQAALEKAGFNRTNIQNESNAYFTAIK